MTNAQIYRKTLPIALLRMLLCFAVFLVTAALPVIAFLLTINGERNVCVIATSVALIVGIVILCLAGRYLGYLFKAGQIAMITKGVTEGELPEHIVEAGKEAVKSRFGTATVYFFLRSAISTITSQLTKGLSAAGAAIGSLGGESGKKAGGAVGDAIGIAVAVVLEYVNYCCLGWVFHNPKQSSFHSTCDGAVLYFQNWKTLLKNAAKILGITLLSFVLIGGSLTLLSHTIIAPMQGLGQLMDFVAQAAEVDGAMAEWIVAAVFGVICWLIVHSALVEPYILVSVLRKYMEAAEQNPPKVDVYEKLCGLSKKFKDLLGKAQTEEGAAQHA